MNSGDAGLHVRVRDAVKLLQEREITTHLQCKFGLHGAPAHVAVCVLDRLLRLGSFSCCWPCMTKNMKVAHVSVCLPPTAVWVAGLRTWRLSSVHGQPEQA